MAIVQNFWLKKSKKRLAGAVLYQAMGQTRARELASSVTNPQTTSQMTQRVKWSNLVNLYRANKGWMKYAFETKASNQSDYNKFMSVNVASSPIYLPKGIANAGGCVVGPFIMTQGSLPSIEVVATQAGWNTNIYLNSVSGFDDNVTIAEMSAQIIANNPAIQEGDQLSFIRMTQQTNATTGAPYVVVRKYEVIIDTTDLRLWYNFMPVDVVGWAALNEGYAISVTNTGNAGGFLFVLSRTDAGKTFVSSQAVTVANNTAILNQYTGSAALAAAIASYGEEADAFLSTTSANEDTQAATAASIVKVVIITESYGTFEGVPGSVFRGVALEQGCNINAVFNQDVTGTNASATLKYYYNGVEKTATLSVDDIGSNEADFVFDDAFANEGIAISDLRITLDNDTYRAPFVVSNEDTQGGLD